jgi:hypothetical protein
MAVFRGKSGALKVVGPDTSPQTGSYVSTGENVIGQMSGWRLSGQIDSEDITEFGDSWAQHAATLKRWSGSAEGYLSIALAGAPNHDEILGVLVDGMTSALVGTAGTDEEMQLTAQFYVDDSGGDTLFGNIIPSFEITGSVAGLFLVSFTFQGSGALTYTTSG